MSEAPTASEVSMAAQFENFVTVNDKNVPGKSLWSDADQKRLDRFTNHVLWVCLLSIAVCVVSIILFGAAAITKKSSSVDDSNQLELIVTYIDCFVVLIVVGMFIPWIVQIKKNISQGRLYEIPDRKEWNDWVFWGFSEDRLVLLDPATYDQRVKQMFAVKREFELESYMSGGAGNETWTFRIKLSDATSIECVEEFMRWYAFIHALFSDGGRDRIFRKQYAFVKTSLWQPPQDAKFTVELVKNRSA